MCSRILKKKTRKNFFFQFRTWRRKFFLSLEKLTQMVAIKHQLTWGSNCSMLLIANLRESQPRSIVSDRKSVKVEQRTIPLMSEKKSENLTFMADTTFMSALINIKSPVWLYWHFVNFTLYWLIFFIFGNQPQLNEHCRWLNDIMSAAVEQSKCNSIDGNVMRIKISLH